MAGDRAGAPGQGWRPLGGGRGKEGDGIALMLDFEAVGRPEACFADLAPMLGPPLDAWTAAQPDHPAVTAGAYLGFWGSGLRESGHEVHAVLGFCVGGVFAAALAEQIGGWQRRPPAVVLLDPEPPTAATLLKQFGNAMSALAAVSSEAELAPAREAVARLGGASDLRALGGELSSLYQKTSRPALERIGLKPDYRADLAASFRSLMSYLAAAGDVRPGPGWAAATAIVSATAPGRPAGVAREVPVGVAHADLLRSPEVARLVSELLA
jgi:hypothetical protein